MLTADEAKDKVNLERIKNNVYILDYDSSMLIEDTNKQLEYVAALIYKSISSGLCYFENNIVTKLNEEAVETILKAGYIIFLNYWGKGYGFFICWDKYKFFKERSKNRYLQIKDIYLWKLIVKYIMKQERNPKKLIDWLKHIVNFYEERNDENVISSRS